MRYETLNTEHLPEPDDFMIVDRELGMIVYGLHDHPAGMIVASTTEAEDAILADLDGNDVESLPPVWYFVEHDEQRDFWPHEFTERQERF